MPLQVPVLCQSLWSRQAACHTYSPILASFCCLLVFCMVLIHASYRSTLRGLAGMFQRKSYNAKGSR